MPIKGRTDTHTEGNGIPSLARLYKGGARDEKRPSWMPPELPYFRLEWQPVFEKHAKRFVEMYGAEPKQIDGALLMGDAPASAFGNWMEEWGAGQKLVTRCDGEHIHDQFDPATQRTARGVMAPCQSGAAAGCDCKQVGRLRFILPEFIRETGVVGTFSLVTHGWYDIMNIDAALKDVYTLYGTLRAVPFTIYRQPVELPVPYYDKQAKEMRRTNRTFQMALVRVQEGYVNGTLALPTINEVPRLMDTNTGEIISDRPALPATTQGGDWTGGTARAWAQQMIDQHSLTNNHILEALKIAKLGDWTGDIAQATKAVEAWMAEDVPF